MLEPVYTDVWKRKRVLMGNNRLEDTTWSLKPWEWKRLPGERIEYEQESGLE